MDDIGDFHIHIIGLGLMGGSLAMVWRSQLRRITASDTRPDVLEVAFKNGLIHGYGKDELAAADVVVVAIPSDHISMVLPTLPLRPGQMVMDIGSTKREICAAMDELPPGIASVSGHPMCGLAENGFENAIPTLYDGARFVLCETIGTTPRFASVAEALVRAANAIPLWMDRDQHDYLTALTSHVPHLLSFALMRLAVDVADEDQNLFKLAAGGFDGATRLARTNETMIRGMFTTNVENIRLLTARLRHHLDRLDALIDDPDALIAELALIVEARRDYSTNYGERPIT